MVTCIVLFCVRYHMYASKCLFERPFDSQQTTGFFIQSQMEEVKCYLYISSLFIHCASYIYIMSIVFLQTNFLSKVGDSGGGMYSISILSVVNQVTVYFPLSDCTCEMTDDWYHLIMKFLVSFSQYDCDGLCVVGLSLTANTITCKCIPTLQILYDKIG